MGDGPINERRHCRRRYRCVRRGLCIPMRIRPPRPFEDGKVPSASTLLRWCARMPGVRRSCAGRRIPEEPYRTVAPPLRPSRPVTPVRGPRVAPGPRTACHLTPARVSPDRSPDTGDTRVPRPRVTVDMRRARWRIWFEKVRKRPEVERRPLGSSGVQVGGWRPRLARRCSEIEAPGPRVA